MPEQLDNTTLRNQIAVHVADNSRNEFFNSLRTNFNGREYQTLLDDLFGAYVVTDQFCDLDHERRMDAVFYLQQMKEILSELGQLVRKEGYHG